MSLEDETFEELESRHLKEISMHQEEGNKIKLRHFSERQDCLLRIRHSDGWSKFTSQMASKRPTTKEINASWERNINFVKGELLECDHRFEYIKGLLLDQGLIRFNANEDYFVSLDKFAQFMDVPIEKLPEHMQPKAKSISLVTHFCKFFKDFFVYAQRALESDAPVIASHWIRSSRVCDDIFNWIVQLLPIQAKMCNFPTPEGGHTSMTTVFKNAVEIYGKPATKWPGILGVWAIFYSFVYRQNPFVISRFRNETLMKSVVDLYLHALDPASHVLEG
jgi:hypothetical protein